jgi:hypothetical protein
MSERVFVRMCVRLNIRALVYLLCVPPSTRANPRTDVSSPVHADSEHALCVHVRARKREFGISRCSRTRVPARELELKSLCVRA